MVVRKAFLIWLILVVFASSGMAYVFDTPDVSSKARGMGGAWVACGDDASAIFYNPASLVEVNGRSVYVSMFRPNGQEFANLSFLAYSCPLAGSHKLAVGFRLLGVEYQEVKLLTESTLSFAYGLPLLRDIHSSLYVGGVANIYSLDFGPTSEVDLGSGTTFGVDLGIIGVLRDRTRIGLFIKNLNEPTLGDTRREPLPQWITAGVSYRPYFGVVTELDIRSVRGEQTEVHMGMEFEAADFLRLRFGFQTEPHSLAGGFSVGSKHFALDYSYSGHTVLPGTHHFALRGVF
ncbi:MAG: hypothetical protein ACUVQ7_04850 [bacterium]